MSKQRHWRTVVKLVLVENLPTTEKIHYSIQQCSVVGLAPPQIDTVKHL